MYLGGSRQTDIIQNTHEEKLRGVMTYVAYPPPDDTEVQRYVSMTHTQHACPPYSFLAPERTVNSQNYGDSTLFLGQIPRLLPLNYVPWALDLLLEEYGTRWVLQTQANGCAKAWVFTDKQAKLLIERSKHLLFDVCGVWVAKTAVEKQIMQAYQREIASGISLDSRVPRNGMVVEYARNRVSQNQTQQLNSQALFQVPRSDQPRSDHTPLPPHNSDNSRRVPCGRRN